MTFVRRIEKELVDLGQWRTEPMPEAAFGGREAFLADTMTFCQWVQFVLLARIRSVVEERGTFPSHSEVGAYAIRALDGYWEAGGLIGTLSQFDMFIEKSSVAVYDRPDAREKPAEPPPAPDPKPTATPAEVVERYWRTRDVSLVHSHPGPGVTYDTSAAEAVFRSATALIDIVGEPEEVKFEELLYNVVVEAERGRWVIRTMVRKERFQWRVDLRESIGFTQRFYLLMHQSRPPYTDVDDMRGRCMKFWSYAQNRNERLAREIMLVPGELPEIGSGQISEFVWYVGQSENQVRVLMNTWDECREFSTVMAERDGKWFVESIIPVEKG